MKTFILEVILMGVVYFAALVVVSLIFSLNSWELPTFWQIISIGLPLIFAAQINSKIGD